jgi:hypothetical protein
MGAKHLTVFQLDIQAMLVLLGVESIRFLCA